jgi:diguanylate cyclase (GGDEF)-like protein
MRLKKQHAILTAMFTWATMACAADPVGLNSLRSVASLTNAEASHKLPTAFAATVIFFRGDEKTLVVQDGDAAVYVNATTPLALVPGDRVYVRGTTHESFRPYVLTSDVTLLHHGLPPPPVPATFDDMITARFDCRRVLVRGRVITADAFLSSEVLHSRLRIRVDGGDIVVYVAQNDSERRNRLLDAVVEVTGIVSGIFDGKMQMTGINMAVPSFADVKVLHEPLKDPWSAAAMPMDRILSVSHVADQTPRIRVKGTITYYQPGHAVVLQDGKKSLWLATGTREDLHEGDIAEAIGFPATRNGFLALIDAEVRNSGKSATITPLPSSWNALRQSYNIFDLVSITGQVVTEMPEAGQDEYILASDGNLFSAVVKHDLTRDIARAPMRRLQPGSVVRVTGICILDDPNPFDRQGSFKILLRSSDDLEELAQPSWLTVTHLSWLSGGMLMLILGVGSWGWSLKRRVRLQTGVIAAKIEAEAALERQRSRILEDINAGLALEEILREVAELVSMNLGKARCWCQTKEDERADSPEGSTDLRVIEREIRGRSGVLHGKLKVAFTREAPKDPREDTVLSIGAWLATIAIETAGLNADLRYRSEFDQLTGIYNRFSFEKRMDALIDQSREMSKRFSVIYIDIDLFKKINDTYGHRVGDLYLQAAAKRMTNQLRGARDTLARVGGDEFCALVPLESSDSDGEEVANRLRRCFEEVFVVDCQRIYGSASIGTAVFPRDGTSRESLLSVADAAMYASKHSSSKEVNDEVESETCPLK